MSEHEDRREPTGGDESRRRRFLRSERVWRRILRRADRSVTQFANFYEHFVRDTAGISCGSDCLDNCARAMGWQLSGDEDEEEAEDEAENEISPLGGNADSAESAENSAENADAARGNDADFSPEKPLPALPVYSLQNLPVSIAATAIYAFAREYWNRIWLGKLGEKLPAFAAAEVLEPLADAHRDLLLGIDAREASECGLAICLLKRALSALNVHFEAAAKILVPPDAVKNDEKYADARSAVRLAALDLRELCLRILRETREDAAGTSQRENG